MIKLCVQIALTALLLFVAMAPTVDSFQTAIPPRVCEIAYKETGINFCGTEPRFKDAQGKLKYPGQVCEAYKTHQLNKQGVARLRYMCDTKGRDQVFFSCESAKLEGRIWTVLKQCFLSKGLKQMSRCPLEDILGGKMLTDCCSSCEKTKLRSSFLGDGPYTAGNEAFFDWRMRTKYPSSEENENCYAEFASAEGIDKNKRSFGPVQNGKGKFWASALFQNCGETAKYCETEEGLVKRYKYLQKVIYPCVAKGLFPLGPGKDEIGKVAAEVIEALKKRFPPDNENALMLNSTDPLLSDIENVKMDEDGLISTRQGWSFGSSSCGAV